MMRCVEYRKKKLFIEDVSIEKLAKKFGTPLYVYSRSHLRGQYKELASAMKEVNPLICYSVKANSNGAVIKTFKDEGAGVDIVSGGELFRALNAGVSPDKIVFAGVGKTRDEIEYALNTGILFFTVESEQEAARISQCAQKTGKKGRIAFRLNPDVDPKTHKYISTGKKENKFGLDMERITRAYEQAAQMPGIEIAGLHMHIGSQILTTQPFADALNKVKDLCLKLKAKYPTFKYIDIGGGIGIRYKPDHELLPAAAFAATVIPILKEMRLNVVMEPGRFLVGNGGILVCRVQYVKDNPLKKFIITDGAMNDLIRPSLYEAHHEIMPVRETQEKIHGDLVGPICESGDFLAKDRDLPAVKEDELVAVLSAGAYGFAMASNYNSRTRPAEVMVEGKTVKLIRKREAWKDLILKEKSFN